MDNDEKKFKLDELPAEGSEPSPEPAVLQRKAKTSVDPRLLNMKTLSDAEKREALSQRWHFENPKMNWGWLAALTTLLVLEKKEYFWGPTPKTSSHDFSSLFVDFLNPSTLIDHPLYLALLIPFIFKFTRPDEHFFELNFGGVSAVKKIDYVGSEPNRVFVKWGDVTLVKKILVGKRQVLEIHDAKGPVGQLIWDIDGVKKKVIKQVLKGLVPVKHPMRIFIEKEVP